MSVIRSRIVVVLGLIFVLWVPGLDARQVSLAPEERHQLIREIAERLDQYYVYPHIALQIKNTLLSNLESGHYASFTDPSMLAKKVHEDALAISQDKHMAVQHMSEVYAKRASRQKRNAHFSYEYISDKVGYLKFNEFKQSRGAFRQMGQAMEALAQSDTLIIDLRDNGGGSPQMVEYLASYFFSEPTLLNTFYDRNGRVTGRVKTFRQSLSEHFAENVNLYILTSDFTFSAAEGFSYHLQAAGKATIVGAVTGGGAHPITRQFIEPDIRLTIPIIRAHNPITQSNWEGKGVIPDMKVSSRDALDTALEHIRSKVNQDQLLRG